jgi:hypothetical protein
MGKKEKREKKEGKEKEARKKQKTEGKEKGNTQEHEQPATSIADLFGSSPVDPTLAALFHPNVLKFLSSYLS